MMTNKEVQTLMDSVIAQVNQAFAQHVKRLDALEAELAELKKPRTRKKAA